MGAGSLPDTTDQGAARFSPGPPTAQVLGTRRQRPPCRACSGQAAPPPAPPAGVGHSGVKNVGARAGGGGMPCARSSRGKQEAPAMHLSSPPCAVPCHHQCRRQLSNVCHSFGDAADAVRRGQVQACREEAIELRLRGRASMVRSIAAQLFPAEHSALLLQPQQCRHKKKTPTADDGVGRRAARRCGCGAHHVDDAGVGAGGEHDGAPAASQPAKELFSSSAAAGRRAAGGQRQRGTRLPVVRCRRPLGSTHQIQESTGRQRWC